MIFISDASGTITTVVPEPIYQGSNNVSKLVLIGPFPAGNIVSVAFTLPNGQRISAKPASALGSAEDADDGYTMTLVDSFQGKIQTISGSYLNAWSLGLKAPITTFPGTVTARFIVRDGSHRRITSTASFEVPRDDGIYEEDVSKDDWDAIAEVLLTAAGYATQAEESATEAENAAENAENAASQAAESVVNAGLHAKNASDSADAAKNSVGEAATYAAEAEQRRDEVLKLTIEELKAIVAARDIPIERGTGENSLKQIGNESISENAFAAGESNIAGCKAFTVLSYNGAEITLADAAGLTEKLAEGEVINCSIDAHISYTDGGTQYGMNYLWYNYATVASVSGNVVTLSKAFEVDDVTIDSVDFLVTFDYPELGDVDYGMSATAQGVENEVLAYAGRSSGKWNRVVGNYGVTDGYKLFANTYGRAAGTGCKANVRNSEATGKNTSANAFGASSKGGNTHSYGSFSSSEGYGTVAGDPNNEGFLYKHSMNDPVAAKAEGINTRARSKGSHTEGKDTVAGSRAFSIVNIETIVNSLGAPIGEFWIYLKTLGNMDKAPKYSVSLNINGEYQNIGHVKRRSADDTSVVTRVRLYPNEDVIEAIKSNPITLRTDESGAILEKDPITLEPCNYMVLTDYPDEGDIVIGGEAHAEGYGTRARSFAQHAQGRFNVEDNSGVFAHIVGNGKSDTERSNAHTVDWAGNGWFAGKVRVGDGKKELIAGDDLKGLLSLGLDEDNKYILKLIYTASDGTKSELGDSIDLPLEQLITGLYYDKTIKKLVLNLVNGGKTEVDIADIASALNALDWSQVKMDASLRITKDWGYLTIPSGSSYLDVGNEGTTIKQLFQQALVGEAQGAATTNPTLTWAPSVNKTYYGEVGEEYSLETITATVTSGKYSYGSLDSEGNQCAPDDTGVRYPVGGIIVTLKNSLGLSIAQAHNSAVITNGSVSLTYVPANSLRYTDDSIYYEYRGSYSFTVDTRYPLDSLGSKDEDAETIKAESGVVVFGKNITFKGYRALFYGARAYTTLNTSSIRSLTKKDGEPELGVYSFSIKSNDRRAIVAVPPGLTHYQVIFQYYDSGEWINMGTYDSANVERATLTKTTVTVYDAAYGTEYATSATYDVYYHKPANGTYGVGLEARVIIT